MKLLTKLATTATIALAAATLNAQDGAQRQHGADHRRPDVRRVSSA